MNGLSIFQVVSVCRQMRSMCTMREEYFNVSETENSNGANNDGLLVKFRIEMTSKLNPHMLFTYLNYDICIDTFGATGWSFVTNYFTLGSRKYF